MVDTLDLSQGFVYVWTNQINGKMYVGSHNGKHYKTYVGSGLQFQRAYKKYGAHCFKREILYAGPNFRVEEEKLLKELNAANSPLFYNCKNEALGGSFFGVQNGMFGKRLTEKQRYKCGNAFRGKKRPEHAQKISGENNPMFGKTEQTHGLKKHVQSCYGKSYEEIFGNKRANEIKQKLSLVHKGKKQQWTTVTCPTCGLVGRGPNMKRYHFENCDADRINRKKVIKQRLVNRDNRFQNCKALYESGMSFQELADLFGCSSLTIQRQLHAENVVFRPVKIIHEMKVCPLCGKCGKGPNMSRYHFKNCKM